EWHESFDCVYQKLTLSGAGQHSLEDCVDKLIGLVKPGGWIKFIDADFTGKSSNGLVMQEFETLVQAFLDTLSVGFHYAKEIRSWLEDVGIEYVQERIFETTYGATCETKSM
ncbi:hypothetical protein K469DRAFT_528823, partial [Zopfia rhizophila CBS 207.26]